MNVNHTEDVLILAIESSCDETAASVVKNGRTVLSNVISSQIATHTVYGGVVPEIASREHIKAINYVIERALAEAETTLDDITAIGVTYGPGLVGALLVGVAEAKAIAYAARKPLIGVHHIEGHVSANFIENKDLEPPFICLIVSGGHTHLVVVKDYGEFEIIGHTRDDAAGEAFDKVARAVGLGYPGGPKIDKAAKEGNPHAIEFPRGKVADSPYDFSFSGLKSAVLNHINHAKMTGEEICVPDLVASFQNSVVDSLVSRAIHAAKEYGYSKLAIAGGVASNTALRAAMKKACEENEIAFYHPSPVFCTDNAAMIGAAAYYEYIKGARAALEQSRAYRQAVQTQLIATIANSYYNLLMLDVQLDINRCTAESWSESLRTLELQKQFGNTTEAAVQQARANLLTVETNVLTLEQQVKKQENAISLLLGDVPSHIERGTLTEQQFPDTLSVGVPLQLLARRPDIRQAEASLAQAFYATGAARSAFYPSITLGGSAGWTNSTGAAIINPGRWLLSAVGSLTHPLFNRGRNIANLRIAKAQQQEALLSFQQSLLKAGSEVNDALAQWQTADRRLQLDGKQIAALRRTVESTRQLMEHSSSTTYLEVLTAQQSLLSAELTEANDHFDKIQGMINLYHALGGGSW